MKDNWLTTNKAKQFLATVQDGEIPELFNVSPSEWQENHILRRELTKIGMWAIVDKSWTKHLADDEIKGRKCLEVMAGNGYLSKALSEHGVDIIATDDKSWDGMNHDVFDVEKLSGVESIEKYGDNCDILIVSWPPYEDPEINEICRKWGKDKRIIFIGEGCGGCTADDTFFDNFEYEDSSVDLPSYWGINDYIFVGYYEG